MIYTKRSLTPTEIKNIHIELSKMAGDYAKVLTETEIVVANSVKMKLPDGMELEL